MKSGKLKINWTELSPILQQVTSIKCINELKILNLKDMKKVYKKIFKNVWNVQETFTNVQQLFEHVQTMFKNVKKNKKY